MKTVTAMLVTFLITFFLCFAFFTNQRKEDEKDRDAYINEMLAVYFVDLARIRNKMGCEVDNLLRRHADIMLGDIIFRMRFHNSVVQLNEIYVRNLARSSSHLKKAWLEFSPSSPSITSEDIAFVEQLCSLQSDCPSGKVEPTQPDNSKTLTCW